jgi:caa(3)-type oxidase subunit IV
MASETHPHITDTSNVHINRKEYWTIFFVLFLLTVLEVGVVFIPGLGNGPMLAALGGLAVVKACMVGWFFMHLSHDTATIRNSVIIAMAIPFFYAVVLIADAVWKLAWTQL